MENDRRKSCEKAGVSALDRGTQRSDGGWPGSRLRDSDPGRDDRGLTDETPAIPEPVPGVLDRAFSGENRFRPRKERVATEGGVQTREAGARSVTECAPWRCSGTRFPPAS